MNVSVVAVESAHVAELVRIRETPEVIARWGAVEAGFPFDDHEARVFSVLVDGAVRGMVQYSEENTPNYRHAGIDIFLDPAVHGRGVGRRAVWFIANMLITERGHHRLTIDPAADNVAAIKCYSAVGFKPVGVMRRYEQASDGSWHDGLLMDLLAPELLSPQG